MSFDNCLVNDCPATGKALGSRGSWYYRSPFGLIWDLCTSPATLRNVWDSVWLLNSIHRALREGLGCWSSGALHLLKLVLSRIDLCLNLKGISHPSSERCSFRRRIDVLDWLRNLFWPNFWRGYLIAWEPSTFVIRCSLHMCRAEVD